MVKSGYKLTEIGVIPEDWLVKSIGDLGHIIRGASPRPKGDKRYYGGSVPRLMVQDVTRDRKFVTPCIDFLTEEGKLRSRPCDAGTLTIVCSGTVGVPSFLAVDACIHDGFLALVNISKDVNDDYIYHYLDTQRTRLDNSSTHGGVFTNLTTEIIREFKVPLPESLDEQELIAVALSDVDGLIWALEEQIAKKEGIKTATMQQLLTGKKRLPGFGEGKGYKQTELGQIPEDWNVKPLGELLKIKHGKSQHEVIDPDGKYPILATGGEIGRTNTPLYSKPSVLIGRKGTIDIPYFMDTPFWTVDTLFYSEIAANADARFLYYKFLFIDWYQYNEASGVPSLNAGAIEKILQIVPSEEIEQINIANFVRTFDIELVALEAKLSKTKVIKQGMMQELLTGKTRLV